MDENGENGCRARLHPPDKAARRGGRDGWMSHGEYFSTGSIAVHNGRDVVKIQSMLLKLRSLKPRPV
jgi:hypothetical protein